MKKLYFMIVEKKNRCIRSIVAFGLVLIAGFAVSGVAQALTLTTTQTLNSTNQPTFTSFNGFHETGYHLTNVELDWDLTLALVLEIDFCQQLGDCEPSIMDWLFGGDTGAFGTSTFGQVAGDYGFDNSTDDLQSTDDPQTTQEVESFKMSLKSSKSFTNFSSFVGTGSIGEVKNDWQSQATVSTVNQLLTGEINLTYTYELDPTPPPTQTSTPTTLVMLGLGLVGIGFQRQWKTVKL